MTIQSLARTIAKARHGTDAMWANYMGAAEAARRGVVEECARVADKRERMAYTVSLEAARALLVCLPDAIRSLIAQPDGAQ